MYTTYYRDHAIKAGIPENAEGEICWESPANIALIKYWGKETGQIPMNASLSFSLKKSVVRACMRYKANIKGEGGLLSFKVNGEENEAFARRIKDYLISLYPYFPCLGKLDLEIETHSTFPHSAGIASSAAAFSALALCLCSMEEALYNKETINEDFFRKASYMARLGSGSACRSVYDGFALWGETRHYQTGSKLFAAKLFEQDTDPVFNTLKDAILVADSSAKKVSSSGGHALMNQHPYRQSRIEQVDLNLKKFLDALKEGDEKTFVEIVENEALTLHGLMMTSNPGYLLMKPGTLEMIEKIREFREETGINVGFTLDAGPNIHLIYFEKDAKNVRPFITTELVPHCEYGQWMDDQMGPGPKKINKL